MSFNDFEHINNNKKETSLEDIFKQQFKSFVEKQKEVENRIQSFFKELIKNLDHTQKQIGDRVEVYNPGGVFDDQDQPVMLDKEKSDIKFEDQYIVSNDCANKIIKIKEAEIELTLELEIFCVRNKRKYYCNHLDLKIVNKDAESENR